MTTSRTPAVLSRIFASLAVLAVGVTGLAAQIDYFRRHRPGITPRVYWLPQALQIWLPGIGAAVLFALAAWYVARRNRALPR